MQVSDHGERIAAGPKRRKHHSYDESVDEAPALIDSEAVDVEGAVPEDENEPVQQVEKVDDTPAAPAFDEGPPSRDEPHE